MFSAKSLVALLTLALSVAATPVARDGHISLSFAKHVNATGTAHLLERDQARAKIIKERAQALAAGKEARSLAVTNEAVSYIAAVGVGSPATTYNLIIDTGSSNTWVGADTKYKTTSTSTKTSNSVSVSYGSGSFSGTEYTDEVTLGSLVIPSQSIGVASKSSGFSGVDGILGIGPDILTQGTLSPATSQTIPTVTDNLKTLGLISTTSIGISFEPTTSEEVTNGELTFGGVDSSKYTGSINYVSLTSTSPASYYWGIDQSISYNSATILSSTAGIVDTGTTLILIATDAYNKYVSATGAKLDSTTGLLRITTTQYAALKNLDFVIGGVTYTLTPNAQIWPRSLNSYIGGSSSYVYLVVGDLGSDSGEGLDFIDGQTFLERFYSVFDTTNQRFGIATTSFTTATTN
ncbi:hypothetical protein PHLGIDRAFT_233169 [Phlebiopsis gigantea 11061_1 CR5-6]|uniref:Peptidase A1 domain-containing protein n=1 Tax=Phlebiopsis gigantea (strain 11061_1 CR5-6) TaxID=745531 RepID=A0A0C3PDZ7_PHLG1|nr:hypothetical protein PHLGIDRAFT_233169 [Phlebiopsis gigantea 11061_1 CR5-6]